MAKKKTDEGLVTIIAGSWFKHDGRQIRPNDVLSLPPHEAAELVALSFARLLKPEPA